MVNTIAFGVITNDGSIMLPYNSPHDLTLKLEDYIKGSSGSRRGY